MNRNGQSMWKTHALALLLVATSLVVAGLYATKGTASDEEITAADKAATLAAVRAQLTANATPCRPPGKMEVLRVYRADPESGDAFVCEHSSPYGTGYAANIILERKGKF